MASTADMEKQKHQGQFLEISYTEHIILPFGENITSVATDAPLNNQKNSYHKYGGIDPFCDISILAISSAADLEKHKNQVDLPLVEIKKQEFLPFSGGAIAAMASATDLEKQKQIPQMNEFSARV